MSFSELAPISNRLSLTSMLRSSAASQMSLILRSISLLVTFAPPAASAAARNAADLGHLRREHAVHVVLCEQAALDLAAGGLRHALHRHHVRDFEARVFVDEARDLRARWA